MLPHPELAFWHKCPICGYCCILYEELSEKDAERARIEPMCKSINKI
jgi:hypothetical protein